MNHRKILVTGGLGFIGSSICERLLQGGARVTIVDSLVSNVVSPEFFLGRYPDMSFKSMSTAAYLANLPPVGTHDLVIHTASLVGPARLLAHGGLIGPEIVRSTASVMAACQAWSAPLIYFSSAEVYGRSGVLSEDSDVSVPAAYNTRIEYALGKLTSEAMLANARVRGLQSIVIRPFNVVGPRQSRAGGFVMPTFVQQALSGLPLTVFGTGKQTRSFTSVDDVVDFVVQYAAAAFDAAQGPFNIGNPENAISILALARRVIERLCSSSTIVFASGAEVYGGGYFEARSFDKIPKLAAATALGWSPRRSLDQIILESAEFYRAQRSNRSDARIFAA